VSRISSCPHVQEAAASRPPRFYVPAPLPAAAGELVELDAEESRHAAKALRLLEGDAVELCDGAGSLLLGRIASVGKKAVSVEAASAPQQVPGCEWSNLKSCCHT
jgi:16S rRNA U1498 N3-methylase RsmE